MASETAAASREVRELVATCQAQLGAHDTDTTLALLVRAISRLTDVVEATAAPRPSAAPAPDTTSPEGTRRPNQYIPRG